MNQLPGLSQLSFGTVSSLNASAPVPSGNAETITKSLEPFHKGQGRDFVKSAAESGFFSYNEPSCAGAGSGGLNVGQSLIGAGLGSIPIVGGSLAKIFGVFGAHHAAAVKTEQATLCRAVPDANNFLRGIDSAVATGQIDITTAAQALEQGYQAWLPEIQAIIKEGGNTCNAACIYRKAFRAAIEKRKQDYAIIASQNRVGAQGVSGVVNAVTNTAGSIFSRIAGAVSSFTKNLLPSSSSSASLDQAGLTSTRQSSLALVLVAGVAVLSIALFSNLFGGNGK